MGPESDNNFLQNQQKQNIIIEEIIREIKIANKINQFLMMIEKALEEKKIFEEINEKEITLQKKHYKESWSEFQTQQQFMANKAIQEMWDSLKKQFILLMNEITQRIQLLDTLINRINMEVAQLEKEKLKDISNYCRDIELSILNRPSRHFKFNGIQFNYNEHLLEILRPTIQLFKENKLSLQDFHLKVESTITNADHLFIEKIRPATESQRKEIHDNLKTVNEKSNTELICSIVSHQQVSAIENYEKNIMFLKQKAMALEKEKKILSEIKSTPLTRLVDDTSIGELKKSIEIIKKDKNEFIQSEKKMQGINKKIPDIHSILKKYGKKPEKKAVEKETSTLISSTRKLG